MCYYQRICNTSRIPKRSSATVCKCWSLQEMVQQPSPMPGTATELSPSPSRRSISTTSGTDGTWRPPRMASSKRYLRFSWERAEHSM
jgi:hypothetical protein